MAKSDIHAQSSADKFGGTPSDYIEIHEMIDSSKAFHGDNRHRCVFHHTAGTYYMQKMFGIDIDEIRKLRTKYNLNEEFEKDLIKLFKHNRAQGTHIVNSAGRKVNVRDIAEQHISEDFRGKFFPTLNDYIAQMKLQPWMDNALMPIPNKESENSKKAKNKISIHID
tara:strand:+ start:18 stop:518 length:501 start_codon:yes stop_codon:yes gene_type:complete